MTDSEHVERLIKKCAVLSNAVMFVANHATSDEGDEDATEGEFGLPASEIIEMAHDNMIQQARQAVKQANQIEKGEM